MKRVNLLLSISLFLLCFTSCKDREGILGLQQENIKEVSISISTFGEKGQTRAPTPDTGHENESIINELDLLVFGSNGSCLYRREAVKLNTGYNNYRALLVETTDVLTVHLLANCRSILQQWEAGGNMVGQTWNQIHAQLIDTAPWRLVNSSNFQALPMWGTVSGSLSQTSAPTEWGPVQLLRSVASVDVYVEQNNRTEDFELTDIYAYYAPNKGYVGAREVTPTTNPKQYMIPSDMTTSLTNTAGQQLHVTGVMEYMLANGKNYEGIAYQLYLYENDALQTGDNNARPTRVIMGGYYKQQAIPEAERVKSYYPIDIVYSDGTYRPIIRNWKYEFKVFAVNGPGSNSLEEAAEAAASDLNIDIIFWNNEEVEIGVKGHYYVTMERKYATLWRIQGAKDILELSYHILDDDPADFTICFRNDANGVQTNISNGIQNDYFQVVMSQTPNANGGAVSFEITALQDYTLGHTAEYLQVQFRNLLFEITITQINGSDNDWDLGGNDEHDLGS
ncbi:MAG: hypothetical protein FWH23_05275 [Bacteroidales bacterium]|nr:hypothetical protein [Bacteroidales bacterium]MCL2133702.1 hypothetical protein [Bacteroidales bacterium]